MTHGSPIPDAFAERARPGALVGGLALWLAVTVVASSLVAPFVDQKMGFFIARLDPADLKLVGDLMQAGKVAAVIDRRYAFEEAAQAMEYLETGRARGKVIVNVLQQQEARP